MTIEPVEMFKTKDGNIFYTEHEAKQHVVEGISAEINDILKIDENMQNHLGNFGMMLLHRALVGDIQKCMKLKQIFDTFL